MEITEQYLTELIELLDKNFGQLLGDPMPHYPAMVGFYFATERDREFFVLGCNTETGDWALDGVDRNERIWLFPNTENATPSELIEEFREFLNGTLVTVHI